MKGIERCESPIQRALIIELSRLSSFTWRDDDDSDLIVGRWPGWGLVLFAEVPIEPYRVDLLICSELSTDIDSQNENGRPPWGLVIECDGHDFHERTKKQARHDRRRDRVMTAAGITVFRFTGSELHRDAHSCASEALAMAMQIQRPMVDKLFTEWLEARGGPGVTT